MVAPQGLSVSRGVRHLAHIPGIQEVEAEGNQVWRKRRRGRGRGREGRVCVCVSDSGRKHACSTRTPQ